MNKQEKRYKEALNSKKRVPLMKIIRLKCLDCMCWQENEVKKCVAKDCILWKYRMGRNPFPRKMSKSQLEALSRGRDK